MKIRIAILAVCASTLALALTSTMGTSAGVEKTFLDGNASFGLKKATVKPTPDAKLGVRKAGGQRQEFRADKGKLDKP